MAIYVCIAFFAFLIAFSKKNKLLFSFFFFILFILSACRNFQVGGDTPIYEALFADPLFGLANVKMTEWGWYAINAVVYYLTGDYRILLIITTALTLIPLFYVSYRHSSYPLFSISLYVLLYYYLFSFCFIRQLIAISFLLLAYVRFVEGNKKQFFFFVFVGMLFHVTAGIAFILPLLNKIKVSSIASASIMILSYFVGRLNLLPIFLAATGFSQIKGYEIEFSDDYRFTFSGLLLTVYLACLAMMSKPNSLYLKMVIVGIFLLNVFTFNTNISRLYWYFLVIEILFIANFPVKDRYAKHVKLIQLSFLFYAVLNYFQFLLADQGKVVPYIFL